MGDIMYPWATNLGDPPPLFLRTIIGSEMFGFQKY